MIKLHLGFVKSQLDPSKDMVLFPYSYINQDFLQTPLSQHEITPQRLFENLHDRELIYKNCEQLANAYILKYKQNFEIQHKIFYPEKFYKLTLFSYYSTIINYTYARSLYIKKFMKKNSGQKFYIETFGLELPRKFETKKEFFINLRYNIEFIEWFSSLIIEKLNLDNVEISRSKGQISILENTISKINFWEELKNLLRKVENIKKFHRIIFFLINAFVNSMPYKIRSFRNIYGIGPIRSLIYSIILNLKAKISKQKNRDDSFYSSLSMNSADFPDDFKIILDDIILKTLPRSIDDLFSHHIAQIEKENTFINGKIRFDSTGFVDDNKSLLHAISASKGEKLVFSQHGSNYCTNENAWAADSYEYCGDYFINWGHVEFKNRACKFIAMPSPHLSRLKNKHKFINQNLILVGTNQRQTMDGICRIDSTYYIDYLISKEIFLGQLNKEILSKLLYRPWPQPENNYFNEEEYIKTIFPELKILKGDLLKEILKTQILILDHYGTAFYEAMAANTPVIFYFGFPELKFTKYAEEMFKELKEVGIIYDDAEGAAKAINHLWYDVKDWWFSSKVQMVRKKFIHLYAVTDKNWNWEWTKFIIKL